MTHFDIFDLNKPNDWDTRLLNYIFIALIFNMIIFFK